MKKSLKFKNIFLPAILLIIFLMGGLFRFYNLNWDLGHYFHPDERNIISAVGNIKIPDQLNPQFFAYGSLPLYLYRISSQLVSWFKNDSSWVASAAKINLMGRSWSALLGTINILLICFWTSQYFSKKPKLFSLGILSAFFFSSAPYLIQSAHYSTTESMLVFWVIIISSLSRLYFQKPKAKTLLFLILASSAAVATKLSALSFLIIPFSTIGLLLFRQKGKKRLFLRYLITFSVGTILLFLALSPYLLLDFPNFRENIDYENKVVSGKLLVPYTLQFQNTLPIIFQFKSLLFTLGPIITVLGFLGLILFTRRALVKKRADDLPDLIFFFFYLTFVGSWYAKQVRHLAPLYPFLIVFAVFSLATSKKTINHLKKVRLRKKITVLWYSFLAVTAFSSLLHGLAFFSIYLRPQTRIVASEWIYRQIPAGARIYTEHWDDSLPLPLENYPLNSQYEIEPLRIYDQDNQAKLDYFATKLPQGDYLVLSSRRLWGTLINLKEKYPLTSKYYQLLFSGQLGFKKVAEFSSYPCLGFPFSCFVFINDDAAEETFQVFDHPKIFIFKNTEQFSDDQIARILK